MTFSLKSVKRELYLLTSPTELIEVLVEFSGSTMLIGSSLDGELSKITMTSKMEKLKK